MYSHPNIARDQAAVMRAARQQARRRAWRAWAVITAEAVGLASLSCAVAWVLL